MNLAFDIRFDVGVVRGATSLQIIRFLISSCGNFGGGQNLSKTVVKTNRKREPETAQSSGNMAEKILFAEKGNRL